MVKAAAKTLALTVAAVKNLRESKGSTAKEILRYISAVYNLSPDAAKREMQTALKRGVTYGILIKNGAHYSLPLDTVVECEEIANQELGLLNMRCMKKRRTQRRSESAKKHKREKRSSRRNGCMCKRKHSRRHGRSRKRSSRRRSKSRSRRSRKRSRRESKCKCTSKRSKRRRSSRKKKRKCSCGGASSERREGHEKVNVKSEGHKKDPPAKCVYFADEYMSDGSDNEKSSRD